MGLDFDAIEYCKKLKINQSDPPFDCPVEKCDRNYKSVCGLQYHLVNYDHDNPQPMTPLHTSTNSNRKKGSRSRLLATHKQQQQSHKQQKHKQQLSEVQTSLSPKENVIYNDVDNTIQYDIDGKSVKISAIDELPILTETEYENLLKTNNFTPTPDIPNDIHIKLPEALYKEIDNYNICDAPPQRSNAYIRFIEKSAEELDGEVEYDVDEEDTTWLAMINEKREEQNLNPISIDTLELLMDRLEKESYFQAAANGQTGIEVDDDAVCCICMDGECQNTNVILFCDMCNLAVHQDCYGVPYIPEGQWLCRRCLQSPSTPVNCVLCPNNGGAFKQTDRGYWAHVVCALWIPEVRFANTVFLEPIDSIETIPPARWRLTCYVCKEKGIGACIQCQRNSCYAAFHVTCAQQAGLYMHMDTVKDNNNDTLPITVQKSAYCHAHTPADAKLKQQDKDKDEPDTRHKMKEARKVLAKKRSTVPVILIPTIPPDRVQEISTLVSIQKKSQFIQKLIAYWTLKRQYRNGVPLLRRLQSQGQSHGGFTRTNLEGSPNTSELYQQLKYWQCLRQDLERARLLCELVRKREKLKVAFIKTYEHVVMLQLDPLDTSMVKLLDLLVAKDTTEIFLEPVDPTEVPDYLDIVKNPMDLGTMREKLKNGQYKNLDDMELDFDLMIRNCLAYNNKDTIFYRAGIRMRDQGRPLFKSVRQELEKEGLIDLPKNDDHIAQEIDNELRDVLKIQIPTDECVDKLSDLIDRSQIIKNTSQRIKKIKQIRAEISKMKRTISKAKSVAKAEAAAAANAAAVAAATAVSETSANNTKNEFENFPSDEDLENENENKTELPPTATPPCSPLKNMNSSASPSGVNRRTAVLFTRKAQAALKRPDITIKEEESGETSIIETIKSPKRPAKSKRPSNERRLSISTVGGIGNNNSPHTSPNKDSSSSSFKPIPDSFRLYRANQNKVTSETDDSELSDRVSGSPCSSCSEFGISGSGSEFCSSSDDDDDEDDDDNDDEENDADNDENSGSDESGDVTTTGGEHETGMNISGDELDDTNNHQQQPKSQEIKTDEIENTNTTINDEEKPVLEPLQLVWAKCRGYPWYPALIIDPQTPKGFVYNGVPLPAPPQDVLNLRKNCEEIVFLVLFFDAKRTWQWLPANKLEILGVDKELDQAKLIESRKPTDRKAVKRAYQDALHYQSQVTDLEGQGPDPIM